MEQQSEHEYLDCLIAQTLDQVFIMRVKGRLNSPLSKAGALADLVKEAYFSRLSQLEMLQAVQLAISIVEV